MAPLTMIFWLRGSTPVSVESCSLKTAVGSLGSSSRASNFRLDHLAETSIGRDGELGGVLAARSIGDTESPREAPREASGEEAAAALLALPTDQWKVLMAGLKEEPGGDPLGLRRLKVSWEVLRVMEATVVV